MGAGRGGGGFPKTIGARKSARIHQGKQDKHIVGTNGYKLQIANGKKPSILTEDPHQLLKEGAGNGAMYNNVKERVDFGRVIGKFSYIKDGQYYDTTVGIIHYDAKGNAHIVPAMPVGFQP